jgi:hypothetical protein
VLVERYIRKNFVERVRRIGLFQEVAVLEHRTEKRFDFAKIRVGTVLEAPAVTLGRRGAPGEREAAGRPTVVLETVVHRELRREVQRNEQRIYWFAPDAPVILQKPFHQDAQSRDPAREAQGPRGPRERLGWPSRLSSHPIRPP